MKDFNSMEGLTDVKKIDGKFEGYTGTLSDGSSITVRSGSSGNASGVSSPTLQINPKKGTSGKKLKVRYGT